MTLEEAIKHCNQVIKNHKDDNCGLDHYQLKEWLQELKQRREEDLETDIVENFHMKEKVGHFKMKNFKMNY